MSFGKQDLNVDSRSDRTDVCVFNTQVHLPVRVAEVVKKPLAPPIIIVETIQLRWNVRLSYLVIHFEHLACIVCVRSICHLALRKGPNTDLTRTEDNL